MNKFLSHRCEVVERLEARNKDSSIISQNKDMNYRVNKNTEVSQFPCKICASNHSLKNCSQFLNYDPQTRNQFVSKNNICINCLAYTHLRNDCPSKFSCSHCKKNHHSLLHYPKVVRPNLNSRNSRESEISEQPREGNRSTATHITQITKSTPTEDTLLPTAIVQIKHQGEDFNARAFFDQGSEKTFISKQLQQQLMLKTETKFFQIHGIGGEVIGNSNSICKLTLYSKRHNRYVHIEAIVVPKVTRVLPNFTLTKSPISSADFNDLELADPNFHLPSHVDLLIGSNVLPQILLEGVKCIAHSLMAQSTIFGWVISGPITVTSVSSFSISTSELPVDPLCEQLRMFWEQEEVSGQRPFSKDDEFCEELYLKTTYCNSEGRYVVKLPFKSEFPTNIQLGSSRSSALAQYNLEQTLGRIIANI